jgi:alpha-beta hydrolase superfamily lysophospholipase
MATQGTFNGVGGAELFFRVLEPLTAPKAAIILIHGHGDHSGGLQNISNSLVKNKYIVYAYDLRGHGQSSGKRGYIRSWDEFRGDLHEFRKLVKLDQPDLPLYIIGHSLGGLITLDYALDYSEGIGGIVAISPGISYEVTRIEKLGISLLSKVKPDYSINKSGSFQLVARDSSKFTKYYSDVLRHNMVTPGLGRGLIHAISRMEQHPQSLKLPILLQYGLADKITPPNKLRNFLNSVASVDKQAIEYASAKHRPFDEVGKKRFLSDLVGWLDQQIAQNQQVLYNVGRR